VTQHKTQLDGKCFERVQIPAKAIAGFFDRYFHIPLPIVTKHDLVFPFPLVARNLPIKFGTNPSKIFLVIVVTDRHTDTQTDKPTPVKTYSLAFAGIKTQFTT